MKAFAEMWQAYRYGYYIILHPFKGFRELKEQKIGRLSASMLTLIIMIITNVTVKLYTGFIFNNNNLLTVNLLLEIAAFVMIFFLWCTVNWCLTTLMDGEGSFTQIINATACALTPYYMINIPVTVLSRFLIREEQTFSTLITAVAIIWTAALIFASVLVTHDYTASKALTTCLLIVVGIAIVIFLGMLFISTIGQIVAFIRSAVIEILYRIQGV